MSVLLILTVLCAGAAWGALMNKRWDWGLPLGATALILGFLEYVSWRGAM